MDRVVIIGGSSGLGLELSKLFLEKNFQVICLSRSKPEINSIHIKTDLTKEQEVENSIEKIKIYYPSFKYLINCAGTLIVTPLKKIDINETVDLFKVNVISPMRIISGLIKNIKENESDILNVGSTAGTEAYPKQTAYGSSKWALRGMNKNLRLELKDTKCRVIGFNPGGFKSKIWEKATGEKEDLKDYMEPKDLAKFILQILELPKNIEVSEILINRKAGIARIK